MTNTNTNTTNDTMVKMDILAYMVENGYHLANRTMEDYCRDFSVEDLLYFCRKCCGGFEE